jgi:acetyl esterase/lipase
MVRKFMEATYTAEAVIAANDVTHEQRTITGPGGDIILSIFRSKNSSPGTKKPGIYHIHGGGMIMANRFLGLAETGLDMVEQLDAVLVTVEYRLAPDHPNPAPIEDCYAGLEWVANNFEALGIDPNKLIIAGASAGGGLAAGTALLARDRGGPKLLAQCLKYPMLDDRNETVSSRQVAEGSWSRPTNIMAWDCYLGGPSGGIDVSVYAAPARATDLSGLPPAYIEVGSAEVFRDECVGYASLLWASGIQAELHVWPGAWHGFDLLFPTAVLSKEAKAAQNAWYRRTFSAVSS